MQQIGCGALTALTQLNYSCNGAKAQGVPLQLATPHIPKCGARVQPSRSRNHCREGSSTVLDTSLLHLKKPTQHLIPGRPVSGTSTQRRTAAHGILHCKCTCCRFPRQPAAGSSSEMPCSWVHPSASHGGQDLLPFPPMLSASVNGSATSNDTASKVGLQQKLQRLAIPRRAENTKAGRIGPTPG